VPVGWSGDEVPVTLASLCVTGGIQAPSDANTDWCHCLVWHLDNAASACVVDVDEDLAWLQSPQLGRSTSPSLPAQRTSCSSSPSPSAFAGPAMGQPLSSLTYLYFDDCFGLTSLAPLADAQLHQLQALHLAGCDGFESLRGLEGAGLQSVI